MHPITHQQARQYLHQNVKELSSTESDALATHLAECASCRIYAASLDTLGPILRKAFHSRWDAVQTPINHTGEIKTRLGRNITMRNRVTAFAGALGSLLALVLLVLGLRLIFGILLPETEQTRPNPPVTQALQEATGTAALPALETPVTLLLTDTPAPTETSVPSRLTICMGDEPDTLFIYGARMLAQSNILEAIYDGPIDTNGFDYQPVILEKLPNLADGDAVIQPVPVKQGDLVVNEAGDVVPLATGEVVRPYGCIQPECAIAWDGSALDMSQMSATFTIKEGISWSDGEPLTAQDSVFSFQFARQCQTEYGPCGSNGLVSTSQETLSATASYAAADDRNLTWTGLPGFLDPNYPVNFFHPLPRHILKNIPSEQRFEAEQTAHQPLGWGAYIIEKYQPGEYVRLSKNPYYFRASEGLPYFDELVIRFTGQDENKVLAAILSGECDLVEQHAASIIPLERVVEMDNAGQIRAYITSGTVWEHVDFNIRPLEGAGFAALDQDGDGVGPFGDVRLRQAIAMCMDRQKVVDTIFLGSSRVLDSYLPLEHPLYNPDIATYPFDPLAASTLLDEIGWVDPDGDPATPRIALGVQGVPDGTLLEFNLETTESTQRQQVTRILADSLAQCGIQVNLAYYPAAEWFADGPEGKLMGRRFDMTQFAWLTGVQPACQLYETDQIPGPPEDLDIDGTPLYPLGWLGQNNTGYSSLEYDAACHAALQALPGMPEYVQYHNQVQEIFTMDLPVVPLYPRIKFTLARPDLCGYQMDPTARSDLWSIENLYFGEECR